MSTGTKGLDALLSELDTVVQALAQVHEPLPLETAIALYEQGVKIAQRCQDTLSQAQQHINAISESRQGTDGF